MLPTRSHSRRDNLRLLGLTLLAGIGTSRAATPDAKQLRVISYNIHHGVGLDGKLDLDRIAAVLKAARPDFVALQEVDQGCRRSGGVKQAEALAGALGLRAVFAKAIDHDGGEYGTALLFAGDAVATRTIALPGDGGEARAAAMVTLRSPSGAPFTVVSLHIDHQSAERRRKQMAVLLATLPADQPALLCGDFNATANEAQAMLPQWKHLPKSADPATFPANAPKEEIDHVFARATSSIRWSVGDHRVVAEPVASDHRPILLVAGWQ